MPDLYYVYIVCCTDGTFYTGYTTNLERRIKTHNQGKGAQYTKGRTPVYLVYWEVFSFKSEALRREHQIKRLSRKQKETLIESFSQNAGVSDPI